MTVAAVTPNPFHAKYHPDTYKRFPKDIANHEMTVLHDDGLYRHLLFKQLGTGMYWFEIVTWPGSLTIKGDMGTYTFSRLTDMFEFFGTGDMNPGYWAEKTPAHGVNNETIRRHDEAAATDLVRTKAREFLEHDPKLNTPEFWERLEEKVLADAHDRETLQDAARDFYAAGREVFTDTWEWDTTEYTPQFLWCCLAIPYAIRYYRHKKANR